jgi:L-ascorbate peroxidase
VPFVTAPTFLHLVQGPVLLRLAYHDAATYSIKDGKGGTNASIQFEFDRPENTGLKRGWGVIQQVRDHWQPKH